MATVHTRNNAMSLRALARAGIASIALSTAALGPLSVAQATPSIPIPPPINFKITPRLLTPTIKPLGPCTTCSPTLPLPPPRGSILVH
jgi:hypothetical protein